MRAERVRLRLQLPRVYTRGKREYREYSRGVLTRLHAGTLIERGNTNQRR